MYVMVNIMNSGALFHCLPCKQLWMLWCSLITQQMPPLLCGFSMHNSSYNFDAGSGGPQHKISLTFLSKLYRLN